MENRTTSDYIIENLTFIGPEESVFKVYEMMKRNQIHHVPVVKEGKAIGIISDRDLQFVTMSGASDELTCKDIMSESPITVGTQVPVARVAKLMSEKRINSVLINNENDKVVGIFTSSDALNILASFDVEDEEE